MTRLVIGFLLIGVLSVSIAAQGGTAVAKRGVLTTQTATTKDGRTVVFSSDGTWKYARNLSKPASPWDGDALQTVEFGGFTFDLKQALFSNGKVTVYMVVTPREENRQLCVHTGITLGEDSVMWDNIGNSYTADQTALANKQAAKFSCTDTVFEIPVRAWMTFSRVAEEAASAPRVKIIIDDRRGDSTTFDFRRVPLTRLQAANAQAKPVISKPAGQDQTVTIKDGRTVILRVDGTWKYAENSVKPKSPWDVDTIQTIQRGGFTFDLKQARLAGGNATFYLMITSHGEGLTLDIMTNDNFANSLLWDDLGNRYVASRSTVSNKGHERMEFIPEVPVKASITYDGISGQAVSAASVKLVFWETGRGGTETDTLELEFRSVPFVR